MNISAADQQELPLPLYDRNQPYNDLPKLPPNTQLETLKTLKKAIGANKALAELRGVGGMIPNQAVLIRAIILQEAKLSSEIENIVTTNDRLYRAMSEDRDSADPNTKEVLRYEAALRHGHARLLEGRPLSATLFEELVQLIKQVSIGVRNLPGTQIVNDATGKVIYTPPTGEHRLRELLDDLSNYIVAVDDIDPLIKMAVMHYQFEAIHPFPDGNGRTGRVLNLLYLLDRGLLDIPVLYMSRYIMEHKTEYYRGLRRVTEEGAWEDWILYMLDAIETTALDTRNRILSIRNALDEAIVTAKRERVKGYSKDLIELVFQQPYTRIQFLIDAEIAQRVSASAYLKDLERAGLLKSYKFGRELLYVNPVLMEILTA